MFDALSRTRPSINSVGHETSNTGHEDSRERHRVCGTFNRRLCTCLGVVLRDLPDQRSDSWNRICARRALVVHKLYAHTSQMLSSSGPSTNSTASSPWPRTIDAFSASYCIIPKYTSRPESMVKLRRRSSLSVYLPKLSHLPELARNNAGADILFESTFNHVRGPTCDTCSKREIIGADLTRKYRLCHCGTITSGNQLVRQSEDAFQGCWFQLLHELLLNGFGFEIIRHDYPRRGLDGWLFLCAAL